MAPNTYTWQQAEEIASEEAEEWYDQCTLCGAAIGCYEEHMCDEELED